MAALLAVGALALSLPGRAVADDPDDILIVVNRGVRIESISTSQLREIFLKKRSNWPGGGKALPVNAAAGSRLRAEFTRRVLEMSAGEEESYWYKRKIVSGDTPPPEFSNTLKAVFKLKGAVSYVYRSQYREGVARVLLVLPAK